MKVNLYTRKIAEGRRKSFYLQITGWKEKPVRENLALFLYARPADRLERNHNESTKELAETIRANRQIELQYAGHGITPASKSQGDLIEYFEKYVKGYKNADFKKIQSSFTHFKNYLTEKKISSPSTRALTVNQCEDFGIYLKGKLSGETARAYFRVFKAVLIRARKDKLTDLVATDIKVSFPVDTAIKKPILNSEEVKALEAAPCSNAEVKRAFLFSLNTGFDFKTVSATLRWKHLDGRHMVFSRSKTAKQNRFPLNKKAIKLLGKPGKANELIFKLGTWEGTVKVLRSWAKGAGIHKNLTYHSARHSFGYRLRNEHKVDISTVGDLLGHSDLKTTKRYEHMEDSTKREAVDKL